MAAGVVHIPWYATLFRGDKFEAALLEIAPVARPLRRDGVGGLPLARRRVQVPAAGVLRGEGRLRGLLVRGGVRRVARALLELVPGARALHVAGPRRPRRSRRAPRGRALGLADLRAAQLRAEGRDLRDRGGHVRGLGPGHLLARGRPGRRGGRRGRPPSRRRAPRAGRRGGCGLIRGRGTWGAPGSGWWGGTRGVMSRFAPSAHADDEAGLRIP